MLRTNSGACDVNIILSFSVRSSYVFETKNDANGSLSSRHITGSTSSSVSVDPARMFGIYIFPASLIILYKSMCRTSSPCEYKMGLVNKTCRTNSSTSDKVQVAQVSSFLKFVVNPE